MNRGHGQTLKVATALAWEFWIHCRQGIAIMLICALVAPGLVYTGLALGHSGGPTPDRGGAAVDLQIIFFFPIVVVILGAALLPGLANPKRRYTLPAPNWLLVVATMACAMATMFVCYAIVAITVNLLFGVDWIILVPGLVAALGIAGLQAVLWSTSNSRDLQLLACFASVVAIVAAIVAVLVHYEADPPDIMIGLRNLGGWQLATFGMSTALATAACASACTAGFSWLRHGSGADFKRIADLLSERAVLWPAARRSRFASPASAQFWLEWAERGFALPPIMLLIGFGTIVLALFVPQGHGSIDAGQFVVVLSAFSVTPVYVIGFYWGCRSSRFEFGNFAGSRPLSDGQLAGAVLKSSTVSLLVSAAIWLAMVLVIASLAALREDMPGFHRDIQQIGLTVLVVGAGLIALAVWSAVGLAASLALAGQPVMKTAFALAGVAYFVSLLISLCFRERFASPLLKFYGFAVLGLCLLGCAMTFVESWRRQLIGWRVLLLAAAIASIPVLAAGLAGLIHGWGPLVVLLGGCLLLPIPLAAAPLAVYSSRHR